MANRDSFPVRCNLKETRLVSAKAVFENPASGSPYATFSNDGGHISSIARDAEGTFKIYFTDKWYCFEGMIATRIKDGDVDVIVLSEDVDNATAGSGYVQVAFQTAGSDADPDGETVHFLFFLGNSTSNRS